jgi:uncharacterized protein (TIGR01777 family)
MKVLITGGSGLIGTAITRLLLNEGHDVIHLSRTPDEQALVKQYQWDIDRQEIDLRCLEGTDAIINLAGATLNHRWTPAYKSLILRSRVDGTRLLFKSLQENKNQVKTLISGSAGGYYPSELSRHFTEEDAPGSDFMALVCQKWELEAQNIEALGIRTVRARIGIVLDKDEGILPELLWPVKLGLGAALGNGNQLMTWIHIDDIARLFLFALENESMSGPFNFAGPETLSNRKLTQAIARVMKKPMWLPAVPGFALKLVLGEMAASALRSNGLSTAKIREAGFKFEFTDVNSALRDLL